MLTFAIAAQIIIALGIFNVWIIRQDRATAYRPEGAANIADEFRRYGLPDWVRTAVGATKLTLATLLLVGLVVTPVTRPAAALMAVLMVAAIVSHMRVNDPWLKSVPAAAMLALSIFVVVAYSA